MRCPACQKLQDKIVGEKKQFCPQCGQQMEEFEVSSELLLRTCSNPKKDRFHDVHIREGDFYCRICGFALAPSQTARTQPTATQPADNIIQ